MIPIIDMHCDTIFKIYELRRQGEDVGLRSNNLHLDLMRMKEAGYMAQCFALFTYLPYMQERGVDPFEYAKALSDTMDKELEANADLIRPALSAGDIARNYREGFLSAIKTVEEGAVYKGSPEIVRFFYDHGVRKSTLTWNFENELAFPKSGGQGSSDRGVPCLSGDGAGAQEGGAGCRAAHGGAGNADRCQPSRRCGDP